MRLAEAFMAVYYLSMDTATPPLSHVLYVDDEPDMRMLVQLALENGGIRVTLCETSPGAADAAAAHKPQMIILDARMPVMDGPATLRALRDDPRVRDIPVLFLTAKSAPEDILEFRAMGALGVIAKPFDLAALPGQLETLWREHHGR
jgi:two-component system OmpR family response regulator